MKTDKLRKKYLEFFKKKKHTFFLSDTLVPADESLLFTSAGMNQFKPYFLGEKSDVKRATSCQKCLRTGDLEKVGKTAYHHTFFEMLGNFSFGDYFKKEAIEFAWEFLTKELKIDECNLWVSVYIDDVEAYSIWKDLIKVSQKRIIKLGEESNYWPASAPSKGPNGVCGPCSEIFFDKGETVGCQKKTCDPDCSCGRFVEIWNLVFTQFNRVGENDLKPLPQKNIDTGMGLERMAAVLQGKHSNFEIDILEPLVIEARKLIGVKGNDEKTISILHAVVDHVRATVFSIVDGIYPSNEDRGYIIRKIIRKALWGAHLLGKKEPFLYKLSADVIDIMKDAYPEIDKKRKVIAKVIKAEEDKFIDTLDEGQRQLSLIIKELRSQNKNNIKAQDLFRLYDTYGLPLELIKIMTEDDNLSMDEKGFDKLLEEQKERSRSQSMFVEDIFKSANKLIRGITEFVGYDSLEAKTNITQIFHIENDKTDYTKEDVPLEKGQKGLINFGSNPSSSKHTTSFYAEGGGQLSDIGKIITDDGEFKVEKVYKAAGTCTLHKGRVVSGKMRLGKATALVDKERRQALTRAHTATHLLQAALRSVLGEHVVQQGSLVDEDEFRFDFTHFSALTREEKDKVKAQVNEFIKSANAVEKKVLTLEQAKKEGALAFFKDKYQAKVRMVSISDYSKELCGGTHVDNTSEIGDFEISYEGSISSGIRRIRACVASKAQDVRKKHEQIEKDRKKVKEKGKDGSEQKLISSAVKSEEQNIEFSVKEGKNAGKESINGVNFLFAVDLKGNVYTSQQQSKILPLLVDSLKQKETSVFVFIIRNAEGKNIFICSATDDLIKKGISCKKFISEFKKDLSLGGGGNDRTARGVILNFSDDYIEKLKKSFNQFISK